MQIVQLILKGLFGYKTRQHVQVNQRFPTNRHLLISFANEFEYSCTFSPLLPNLEMPSVVADVSGHQPEQIKTGQELAATPRPSKIKSCLLFSCGLTFNSVSY